MNSSLSIHDVSKLGAHFGPFPRGRKVEISQELGYWKILIDGERYAYEIDLGKALALALEHMKEKEEL